jgi:hypothetical protein
VPERPDPAEKDEDGGGYAVPTQFPAPPDVAWSRGGRPQAPEAGGGRPSGPPVAPPEDGRPSLWGPPSEAPPEPERWGQAPHRYGSTAVLDRPTSRRPVVAPPVRPAPVPASQQSWDWERSHGLRNALIVAALILLVGSLIAALVVFRSRDDSKQSFVEPPPATVTIQPIAPSETTVASTTPVSLVPVTPATTAAPAPTTTSPAPPTTVRPATVTTRRVTPTVTASPPHPGCPPACPTTAPPTTRSSTTSSSSTTTPTQVPS